MSSRLSVLLLLCAAVRLVAADLLPWPRAMPFPAAADAPWSLADRPPADLDQEGILRVQDGRFAARSGRVRLFGVNQSFSAMFPAHDEAVRLADQFARLGFNAVRMVSIDHVAGGPPWPGLWGADGAAQRSFDPGQLDRLDHFIAQLKRRGIRVVLCLHFNRLYPASDLVDPAELGEAGIKYSKGVDQLDPVLIERQRRFAADLLTRVNPYTGLALKDDPVLGLVEVNNENSVYAILWHKGRLGRLPPRLLAHLDGLWREFLAARHRDPAALAAAWGEAAASATAAAMGLSPGQDGFAALRLPRADPRRLPAAIQADLADFLRAREAAYWDGQIRWLKEELGLRQPITGTQMAFTWQDNAARFDYVDAHAYWHHPEFAPGGEWSPDSARVRNQSMVTSASSSLVTRLASARLAGKPFVVGEYNHAWPNDYRGEGVPMLALMASLQDWDGIFLFNFMNGIADQERIDFFCLNNAFLRLHTLPFAALAFRDGLVPPFAAGAVLPLRVDQAVAAGIADQPLPLRSRRPLPHALASAARVAVELTADGPGLDAPFPQVAPDPRLAWRPVEGRRCRESVFAYDDARAKAWIGWPGEAGIRLDGLAVDQVASANGWCQLTLVNRDGAVGGRGRHLLTLASLARYTGAAVVDRQRGDAELDAGDHHGALVGPRLLRTDRVHTELLDVPRARVRLRAEAGLAATLHAIGPDGAALEPALPVERDGDHLAFPLGEPRRSIAYVLDLR